MGAAEMCLDARCLILRLQTPKSRGDRWIALGDGLAPLPERLLLAHAQGRVLFIAGAGVSRPSGYPDFRKLVVDIYEAVDQKVFEVLEGLPAPLPSLAENKAERFTGGLNSNQAAEVDRFLNGDFDVTLGMLERRLDTNEHAASRVRKAIRQILRGREPTEIHHSLLRLAHRGGAISLATTNFDLLFEEVNRRRRLKLHSSALGAIPRPSERPDFAGIFHIHGMLDGNPARATHDTLAGFCRSAPGTSTAPPTAAQEKRGKAGVNTCESCRGSSPPRDPSA